jgi:hypothetical protein
MDLAVLCGVASGGLYALGYALYLRKILAGGIAPNMASWLLWTVLTVANCASYLALAGDPLKAAIPLTSSVACAAVFLVSLRVGRFAAPDPYDAASFAVGVLAALVWWRTRSAVAANLIMQGCLLVSFVPTWRGVLRDPAAEPSAPWLVWTASYPLTLAVLALRWRGHPVDLVYPLNCIVLHGGVGLLALRRPRSAP